MATSAGGGCCENTSNVKKPVMAMPEGGGCCENARNLVPDKSAKPGSGPVTWKRQCGCIRTSEKLKHIINTFPAPPPPSPTPAFAVMETAYDKTCGYTMPGHGIHSMNKYDSYSDKKTRNRSWQVIGELVQLVQLSVTATALALYYLIYCYMQLVYYTLRSALFFHNADGPMKITIGVVTLTSIIIGFNILLRMERLIGILA